MHLTATLGTASVLMNWEHERTKDSDEIQVVAAYVYSQSISTGWGQGLTGSIFPKDDLRLKFTARAPPA